MAEASRGKADRFEFHDLAPVSASFRDEVLHGLSQRQKSIPAKYFYDDRGSQLFEAICELPEYYPTRTEIALMRRYAGEMAHLIGPNSLLIEYGSGSSKKTRLLIDAASPAVYMPIDISRGLLAATGRALAQSYPALHVVAVCADYSRPFELPDCSHFEHARRVVYFPGSTIGNFDANETSEFLGNVRRVLGAGGMFLVGVDLTKNPMLLHAAYNDAQGVTAAFNTNLLQRMNGELKADFDLAAYRHHAFYDSARARIEMHLVSLIKQTVSVQGRQFVFEAGETLHTEISCKYSVQDFQRLATAAGFKPTEVWVDDAKLFSVHCLRT